MTIHPPHKADIDKFGALLRAGEIVAFPTETVYGLGADATNSDAVLKIYETKGRPRFNPLIVHVADLDDGPALRRPSRRSREKLARFWPGTLTLVLPRRPDAGNSDLVTGGHDTVGIRSPAHKLAIDLIRAAGVPVAAPSANPSGKLSPTTAAAGRPPLSLVASRCSMAAPASPGVESTILAIDGDTVTQLRAGGLAREDIEAALGHPIALVKAGAAIASPGMLASHYAPNAQLRLNATSPNPGEAYLAFGAGQGTLNLSPTGDLHEAARNLFAMLHQLDATATAIAVAPIPHHGLGEAINDRLKRAAAPR